jgi:hypothetical protein
MRFSDVFIGVIMLGFIYVASEAVLYGTQSNTTFTSFTRTLIYTVEPTNTFPFVIFLLMMIATVDYEYFPTGAITVSYFVLMFVNNILPWPISWETILTIIVASIGYLLFGAVWLWVKWWSYLRDPVNVEAVRKVVVGDEVNFFVSKLKYLYPHFLYWPLSMPHTILTRLFYQIFEYAARYWSGTFGRMVAVRRAELAWSKP